MNPVTVPATPCEACRYTTDGGGRLVFQGCVRCDHRRPEPPLESLARATAQHGSLTMYTGHRCRCRPCREAYAAYRKRKKQAVAA